ncbi:GNAT family N-acetyltransferase [Lichenifustis flavocetrariae]|uniref:GNAT family N-acetyltransferase n=1 Tax=Lichenifustis flavocetrariae TaxID=2949735 RepID=A0AA41Z018_9HYPH|nr:GNAT family N-acetyltransferase [Lichenifustis flavocetrariae]MCW6510387.1 GNAT family N-acetyltransferase [Lichenifustis flavocetrariae]
MVSPAAPRSMAGAARIRAATLADLDAVEALETTVFHSDQLSRRSLRYYIGTPTARFLVLEATGAIVGDAILAFRRGSRLARLYSIAIHPDQAGRGHGGRLLAACEAAAAEHSRTIMRLEVRADNQPAIQLYRKAGYHEFGHYPDYYEDGTAALRFEKEIAPPGGRSSERTP